MKLSKSKRHLLYVIMEYEIENRSVRDEFIKDGFCFMLCHKFGLQDSEGVYTGIIDELLPELKAKKPKEILSTGLWFKGNHWKPRLQILKQCIEETADF